jgi:hypothetical protein
MNELQLSNVAAQPLTLQLRGSNLVPEIAYNDLDFSGFPQSLRTNAGVAS